MRVVFGLIPAYASPSDTVRKICGPELVDVTAVDLFRNVGSQYEENPSCVNGRIDDRRLGSGGHWSALPSGR